MGGEAFGEVAGGEPAGEGDEACCVYYSVPLRYPGGEGDGFGVDGFAAGFAVGGGEGEESGGGGAVMGEEEAAFFETFPDRGVPVGRAVFVSVGVRGWGEGTVLGGDVAAGEDVSGGEGGGCADAVEEEDAVCGGYEKDAGAGLDVLSGFKQLWCRGGRERAYLALGLAIGSSLGEAWAFVEELAWGRPVMAFLNASSSLRERAM